jgi:hypothetical protein
VRPFDALVRGRRLDGSVDGQPDLGFGDRLDPLMEMHLAMADSESIGTLASLFGWKLIHGDVARVRRTGCYAVQIDTPGGSEAFAFEATYALEAVSELRARPLDPTAITEASCDRIQARDINSFALGALGDGPPYLVWQAFQGRRDRGPISLSELELSDGWYALPVAPWLISPRDRGPTVIRSDGPHEIRFGGPGVANDVEVLPVTSTIHGEEGAGWRAFFSNMWIREPGCYGLQVDTISGSEVFPAFKVVP